MNKEELMTLPMLQGTSHCSCLEHCFLFCICIDNCAKSLQGEAPGGHAVCQSGPDVPVPTLSPLSPGLCPPPPKLSPSPDFVPPWTLSPLPTLPPPYVWCQKRQSSKSLSGQLATRVLRGNICYSGLRTAVALSTASF